MKPLNWNLVDILRLNSLTTVSNSNAIEIINDYSSFDDFIRSENRLAVKARQGSLFNDKIRESQNGAEEQIKLCEDNNVSIISFFDRSYPELLREITGPPLVLFVAGRLQPEDVLSISIVGTRKVSQYGQRATEKFASEFAKNGIIVTSGLATGVDSFAHAYSIKNAGITYAVIASGIDKITPSEAQQKAKKIIEKGGAVISEYPCGTPAQRAYFPQRNRIISGISKATVIIESADKGGALITAKFAFDQEREVYAVPGNIDSDRSKGTNKLIRDNLAKIALSAEQVLIDLGIKSEVSQDNNQHYRNLSDEEKSFLEYFSNEPVHIDELCSQMNQEMPSILVKLLEFEFKGLVKQLPGKYYIKEM